jgi:dihydropyrimidinase
MAVQEVFMKVDTLVINGQLVIPKANITQADVAIRDGSIIALLKPPHDVQASEVIDAHGHYILPGLIDPHVHLGVGSPDDYHTETQAAAIGGITCIGNFLMKNEPYEKICAKDRELGETSAYIDFFHHFTIMNQSQIAALDHYLSLGVSSYKYMMNFKGDEGLYLGVTGTDDGLLWELMESLGKRPKAITAIHCENIEVVWQLRRRLQEQGAEGLEAWDASRPDFVEANDLDTACFFAELTGARLYVVHLTCSRGLEVVLRRSLPNIYVETCPHYLTHTKHTSIGSLGKVSPPLRSQSDITALWEAVFDGTIDVIGSDHLSRGKKTKLGSIWEAAAGFPGMPTLLPVLLSEGVHKRGLDLTRVAEMTSYNPARIFGLWPQKGTIGVGSDADLTIIDLALEEEVTPEKLLSSAGYSIYEGWLLKGWPVLTMVRGTTVMRDGKIVGQPGHGQLIARS